MNRTNLNAVDLNLFKVLQALHEERSVTKAAKSLGLSQPAVSHALNRLRSLLADELFVRTPTEMRPTARCQSIVQQVALGMETLIDALREPVPFDPSEVSAVVKIIMSDLLTGLMPSVFMPIIVNKAPNIDFRILPAWGLVKGVTELTIHDDLDSGSADLAFSWNYEVPSRFSSKKLGDVDYVCVGSASNAGFTTPLSVDFYQTAPHISTTTYYSGVTRFEREIAATGHTRNVRLRLPHYSTSMHVASKTDMITSIPRILAPVAVEMYGLRVAELPIPSPVRSILQVWHKANDSHPVHAWARELTAECYVELDLAARSTAF
ncbi:MAG: LysR family transcriptional regulator [Hyphomicrobiales bacterium]|jgi:DNA-binding transcriptional LysR family regulator